MINPIFLIKYQFDKKIDDKKSLYEKIENIRKALELKKENNSNLKNIIESNNIAKIVIGDIGNFSGALDKKINTKPVILLNKNSNNLNFVLAHELVHLFITPLDSAFKCYNSKEYLKSNYEEWRANEGAAELLLPYKEFIPDYSYLLLYKNYKDCLEELSKIYSVSKQVIEYRIKNLSQEIHQYLSGVDIENIKIK